MCFRASRLVPFITLHRHAMVAVVRLSLMTAVPISRTIARQCLPSFYDGLLFELQLQLYGHTASSTTDCWPLHPTRDYRQVQGYGKGNNDECNCV